MAAHAEESRRIASELAALGLRVVGPVDGLAGWRPGAVVAHSVTSPKLAALSDRYSFAAAGLSAAIAGGA